MPPEAGGVSVVGQCDHRDRVEVNQVPFPHPGFSVPLLLLLEVAQDLGFGVCAP